MGRLHCAVLFHELNVFSKMLLGRLDGSIGANIFWENFFSVGHLCFESHFDDIRPCSCLSAFLLK
jgi:hypothetical protein